MLLSVCCMYYVFSVCYVLFVCRFSATATGGKPTRSLKLIIIIIFNPSRYLLNIHVNNFFTNGIPSTRSISSAAWEQTAHLVCSACERKFEYV
jgi:hypothetical protein